MTPELVANLIKSAVGIFINGIRIHLEIKIDIDNKKGDETNGRETSTPSDSGVHP